MSQNSHYYRVLHHPFNVTRQKVAAAAHMHGSSAICRKAFETLPKAYENPMEYRGTIVSYCTSDHFHFYLSQGCYVPSCLWSRSVEVDRSDRSDFAHWVLKCVWRCESAQLSFSSIQCLLHIPRSDVPPSCQSARVLGLHSTRQPRSSPS